MAIKDKLQKLLKKVTNKDIVGDNIEEVIADAEAKYEGGCTDVVANPILEGTESDLTGLEVDGTKYKVSNADVVNLCDYIFNTACANCKSKINREAYYKLDVESLIQFVKDSGIGELPFEPNLIGTEHNGIDLIISDSGNCNFSFTNESTSSDSRIYITFANQSIEITNLVNLEGDNFVTFLERNKNAIAEEVNQYSFYGENIVNTLDDLRSYYVAEMCKCNLWKYATTSPSFYHSINLTKFIDIFKEQ